MPVVFGPALVGRRWLVEGVDGALAGLWVAVLMAALAGAATLSGPTSDAFRIPRPEETVIAQTCEGSRSNDRTSLAVSDPAVRHNQPRRHPEAGYERRAERRSLIRLLEEPT
jgi:hypothetical protein